MQCIETRKLNFAAWLKEDKGLTYIGCDSDGVFKFQSDLLQDSLWVEFLNSQFYRTDNTLVQLRKELPKFRRKK